MLQKTRSKERKTGRLLYFSCPTEVYRLVFQSFFSTTFLQQDSLLVLTSLPCLLFTGPSLLVLNFYRYFFLPLVAKLGVQGDNTLNKQFEKLQIINFEVL